MKEPLIKRKQKELGYILFRIQQRAENGYSSYEGFVGLDIYSEIKKALKNLGYKVRVSTNIFSDDAKFFIKW